jgi:hypothetical protein
MKPWSQGDIRWKDARIKVDDASSTVGRIGCALVACSEVSRRLAGSTLTPLEMLTRGQDGAFLGRAVKWRELLAIGGCKPGEALRDSMDIAALRVVVEMSMRDGLCLLHVDRDDKAEAWRGDHWVTALAWLGRSLVVADPAGGKTSLIDVGTMSGPAPGGKRYKVRGIIPVERLVP